MNEVPKTRALYAYLLHENTSIYLDLLRFLAALCVLTTHANVFLFPSYKFSPPLGWGREAVALFFVLSGFVISLVAGTKELTWVDYAVARAARILPVAVFAIFFTYLLDSIGAYFNSGYYEYQKNKLDGFYVPASISAALSYITFTSQIWFKHTIFGTDEPYWSLSFEVQYYVFFFGYFYLVGKKRIAAIVLWMIFVGPKILAYLPLWLMGLLGQKIVTKNVLQNHNFAWCLTIFSVISFLAIKYSLGTYASNMYRTSAISHEMINITYFNLIGLCVFLNIIGVSKIIDSLPSFNSNIAFAIRWLAGASFTIYLLHEPMLAFVSSFAQRVGSGNGIACVSFIGVIFSCFMLAEITERPKKLYAKFIRMILHLPIKSRLQLGKNTEGD